MRFIAVLFSSMLVAFVLSNAATAQSELDANSRDGHAIWNETSYPVVRTLAELRRLQKEVGQHSYEVDLQAQLSFSARYWSVFFIQDGDIAAMVHCTDGASAILCNQPVGKWLRLRGLVYQGALDISLVGFDLLEDVSPLTPLHLTQLPLSEQLLADHLKDRFVELPCQLLESLDQATHSLLFAKVGDRVAELHVEHFLTPEQHLAVASGAKAIARGVLSPKNKWVSVSQAAVRMLGSSQLTISENESANNSLPLTIDQTGQVLFTDEANQIVIGNGKSTWRVATRFAQYVKAGSNVTVSGRMIEPDGKQNIAAQHMTITQESELPPNSDLSVGAWEQTNPLPARVQCEAIVVSQEARDGLRFYHMRSANKHFTAIVNEQADPHQRFRTGDRLNLAGTPFIDAALPRETHGRLKLYVVSPSDTQFVSAPIQLSITHLGWAASIGLLLVGIVFSWNWLLHLKVNERTQGLKKVSSHLRMSFDAITEAVLVTDAEGRLSVWNKQFERLFGEVPVEDQPIEMPLQALRKRLADPSKYDVIFRAGQAHIGDPISVTLNLESPVQIVRAFVADIIDNDGTFFGHLYTFDDITERLRLESELFQSQKMDAIGQLSGGVAHDFNNLLTVVASNLALIKLTESSARLEYVQAAETAVGRAAKLTQQLLDFSRRSKLEIQVVNLNDLVGKLGQLLRRTFDRSVSLQIELCSTPLLVCVDINRIEQVLINICINARDALRGRNGKITVRVLPGASAGLGDETHACIEIEDNGYGMTPEVQSRIFDPFFTTKKPGEGTGLGLSMAQGVIEQLGGRIHCTSKIDVGTRFRIELPLTELSASSHDTRVVPPVESQHPLRILLVDDEQMVRKAGQALLSSLGHWPVTASSGREALALLETQSVDVVLLDLTMPSMSGKEVYAEIHKRWPDLPVAICTGYNVDLQKWNADCEIAPPRIISKPYTVESLSNYLNTLRCRPVVSM